MTTTNSTGPLAGLRVVEFVSIGPGPHCAMLLSDLGADVLRIDRADGKSSTNPIVDRGRATQKVDIRSEGGRAFCLEVAAKADVVIEGFRPGVMERLGLGPGALQEINPRLVYGRMTGWGQTGPLSPRAGHDINYIAMTGALAAIGRAGDPAAVPLNLIGDFGGGSMFLAFGIMAALWERERSGQGQVVDAAIVDGVSSLMTMFAGLVSAGKISLQRDRNILAGAAPFYRSYLCRDGKEMSVGPLEPKFFAEMMDRLGLDALAESQNDREKWPELVTALENMFLSEPQAHWTGIFEGSDACVMPVLELEDVPFDAHHEARQTYQVHEGLVQASPAPRFSRTPGAIQTSTSPETMLSRWT